MALLSEHKTYNILLLGKTGAGMSTFVNAFANYFTYKSFDEAMKANEPISVIPTSFKAMLSDLTDLYVKNVGINRVDIENECFISGHSATKKPRVYSFYNENIKFNFIDTPGSGSTFGLFQDIKNKKYISAILKKCANIHGIFILGRSFGTKLTAEMRYNLNEIFMLFHKKAIPNIMFVITNTRATDYHPGDTMCILKKYVSDLKEKKGITIDLNEYICVDNEAFKFQCCWNKSEEFRKEFGDRMESYKQSWNTSRSNILKLLQVVINNTNEYDVSLSIKIEQARTFIHEEVYCLENMEKLFLSEEMERRTFIGKILEFDSTIQHYEMYQKAMFENIIKFQKHIIFDSNNTTMQNRYEINRDLCLNISPSSSIFVQDIFDLHVLQLREKIKGRENFKNIMTKQMTNNEAEKFFNWFVKLIQKEKTFIQEAIQKLSCYLQQNAIILYNDAFENRINLEIRKEEATSLEMSQESFRDINLEEKIKNLEKILIMCEMEIAAIKNSLNHSEIIDDRQTVYENLNNLSHNGINIKILTEHRTSEAFTNLTNEFFSEKYDLIQRYYLKFKASLYFSSNFNHQILFVSKNATQTKPFIKAIINNFDCFFIDDCFAFNDSDLNGSRIPKKYWLEIMDQMFGITEIPIFSQAERRQKEVIANVVSKLERIKAVCLFIDINDLLGGIQMDDYFSSFPKTYLSNTIFFLNSCAASTNEIKNAVLQFKNSVEKYNKENGVEIKFENDNVFILNNDAIEELWELLELEKIALKIPESLYQKCKDSVQEIQRFFNILLNNISTTLSSLEPIIADNQKAYVFPKKITDMDQNIAAVGIDLGTSRSCVALNRKNGIESIPLDNMGERQLPSYVAYDEENPKCCQTVVDRLRYFSESTVFDSKRFIGKNVVSVDKMWPFKIVYIDNQPMIQLKTNRGEIRQTATEVAAVLLKFMKEKAEQFQGKKLSKVIITVPAAFTLAQENATKEAAILAGWESVTLLPEPIAASFAYFIDRPIPNNSILLLFDLGGGTLDVCVFRIINNQIRIISENGDPKLGGRDFDNLLMDYFLNKLNMDYDISKVGNNMLNLGEAGNKLNLKDFRDKKFKLLMECSKIKHSLSVNNEAILSAADIDPAKDENIKITQQNFRDLSEDLLNKIQNTILSALYKSGFKVNQIDKVLLVGGGCRMPMIKNLLRNIFPSAEQCCEEHPDEVVAKGAAYYAYNIFSD